MNVAGCLLDYMVRSRRSGFRLIAEKRLRAKDRDPAIERSGKGKCTTRASMLVLDNYIARMLGTKRSKPAQVSAFDRLVRPEIWTRSIYDLRRADIAGLLDKIEDSAGPVAADRTLAYIRAAFHWQAVTTTSHRRSYAVCRGPRQRNDRVKGF